MVQTTRQPYTYADDRPTDESDPSGKNGESCTGFISYSWFVTDGICIWWWGSGLHVSKWSAEYYEGNEGPMTGHLEIQYPAAYGGGAVVSGPNSSGSGGYWILNYSPPSFDLFPTGTYNAIFWWYFRGSPYVDWDHISVYLS